MTEDITQTALAYIDDAAKSKKPFFLYVAYTAPHTPLQAPREEIEKMLPSYRGKSPHAIASKRLEKQKQLGIVPPSAKLGMAGKFNPSGYEKATAERKDYLSRCMATYAAQISIMDRGIGRILASLDRHRLSGNTIVMFLSDNGATAEMPQNNRNKKTVLPIGPLGEAGCRDGYGLMWAAVSNTPYRQYKIETFDGGLSAPFIIRYPSRIRPGARYHSPFLLQDLAPTCLAWAQLPGSRPHGRQTAQRLLGQSRKASSVQGMGLHSRHLPFPHHFLGAPEEPRGSDQPIQAGGSQPRPLAGIRHQGQDGTKKPRFQAPAAY